MNKIIMVDGNNLLFRSYYATAYNGNFMKNSKGFPTNALFGFTNMINKIIKDENPQYMIVAFDKGKTFRHLEYADYKGGRLATPDELKQQLPKAKDILEAMGIKYYDIDLYEADDIIGTFAKYCDEEPDFIGTIVSSDKDLLQLISHDVDIKLLKTHDAIRYNELNFNQTYGFKPINVIDLKALMGDASDSIKGVKGIGEKTALKLIQTYQTLDNLYEHIDDIKGKLHDNLVNDKAIAYQSAHLATIVRDVPMDIKIPDIKYLGPNEEQLKAVYTDLEFYSLIKQSPIKTTSKPLKVKIINKLDELNIKDDVAIYLELSDSHYHTATIYGMAIYNQEVSYYVPFEVLKMNPSFLTTNLKYTYDLKKTYVALKWHHIDLSNVNYDAMIAASLLEYNVKDDIAYLASTFNYDIPFFDGTNIEINALKKAQFIYETRNLFLDKLKTIQALNLFDEIEMPLAITLGDMEYDGILVDPKVLKEMGEELKIRMELTSNDIYNMAGSKFNISSPQQLGHVLFETLGLEAKKKTKTGYSTNIEVLNKLRDKHPIIDKIIEYRTISKLYSTYIEGLLSVIGTDSKIHTIYTQTITRTGRLSSIEPNLQNIPARSDEGKLIRKAFIPTNPDHVIVSADYSQIELRVLAHMANIDALIVAFKNNEDIHTKTARDIFKVQEVTPKMRRMAKAVNFGIIYGISSFGLATNAHITVLEAKTFMNNYFNAYPGIKDYMNQVIAEAKINGYVTTLFNRRRTILELQNKNALIQKQGERMALNTPIQGTAADIIKKAMVAIHRDLIANHMQTKMLLQVHDELVFDTPKAELELLQQLIKKDMEEIITLTVPLKVDIEYGINWYDAK